MKIPKKHTSTRISFAMLIALALLLMNTLSAQDVSRFASWNAPDVVFSGNSHGSTLNPNQAVWSYFHQAGRDSDGQITDLQPTLWSDALFSDTSDRFYLDDPSGSSVGYVRMDVDKLETYWNISGGNSPVYAFRPSWAISTYTEFNSSSTYKISGSLSWTATTTVPTSGIVVIAKISSGTVTELYRESVSSSTTGTFQLFDSESIPESLTSITLAEGDQLAFSIRGYQSAQFRRLSLDDSALTLTMIPEPEQSVFIAGFLLATPLFCIRRKRI